MAAQFRTTVLYLKKRILCDTRFSDVKIDPRKYQTEINRACRRVTQKLLLHNKIQNVQFHSKEFDI